MDRNKPALMLSTAIVNSTAYNTLRQLLVKIGRLSGTDTQQPLLVSPAGIDSNPVKDMVAIYAPTSHKGTNVVIGYIQKDLKAAAGELRLRSTDSDGNEQTFIWLKADGKTQLGGTADNAVRYQKLDDALQMQKDLLNAEFAKIQIAIAGLGGVYTAGQITIDTSAAKIDNIQTP